MKTERIEIVRITIDTEHYVDIIPSGDCYECWIYRNGCISSHFMYGLPYPIDEVINTVKSTAVDYIDMFDDNDED